MLWLKRKIKEEEITFTFAQMFLIFLQKIDSFLA